MIVVCTMALNNYIRKHPGLDDADFMEYEKNDMAYKDFIDTENVEDGYSDNNRKLNVSSGSEMELIGNVIACMCKYTRRTSNKVVSEIVSTGIWWDSKYRSST
ncbi:hypothetical protein GQ457_07G004180 [Hibiscus cannabinus]